MTTGRINQIAIPRCPSCVKANHSGLFGFYEMRVCVRTHKTQVRESCVLNKSFFRLLRDQNILLPVKAHTHNTHILPSSPNHSLTWGSWLGLSKSSLNAKTRPAFSLETRCFKLPHHTCLSSCIKRETQCGEGDVAVRVNKAEHFLVCRQQPPNHSHQFLLSW